MIIFCCNFTVVARANENKFYAQYNGSTTSIWGYKPNCTFTINMVDFGSNLKELRLKHKMTQKELADKIGVTKSVVSYYELQERSPSPEILIKLSGIFHVTTDYLLGIEHTHTIDVSNLSSEQLTVIEQLIKLFESDDK